MTTVDSRQQPLFDVRSFLGEPYEVSSFYWMVEYVADLFILRDDFPEADHTLGGKEGWCPVLKSKLVLIQRKEGWSDRRAVEAARSDLRVKAALNLGVEAEPPKQPTLSRHRQLMEALGLDTKYMQRFQCLLEVLELLELDEPVAIDSVPVAGAGQVRDTYNLLGDAIRRGLAALASEHNTDIDVVATALGLEDYLTHSVKGLAEIDWSKATERRAFLDRLVTDAQQVRRAIREGWTPPDGPGGGKPSGDCATIAESIDKVIEHDVEFDEDGNVAGVLDQDAANGRLISLTDLDMRHGRKSASQLISGFKAQIVATLATGWILILKVIQANRHDGRDLPDLIAEARKRGLSPRQWVGDHAYGILDNHVHVADLNEDDDVEPVELIARNSRPGNGGKFPKVEFPIDWSKRELTCPAGYVAQMRYASKNGEVGWEFKFDGETCANCPLRSQCVSPQAKATTGRTVFFIPRKERLLRQHLEQREKPEFQEPLKERWRVEQAIAGFAQCAGKQARRMGIESVEFDARMSALAHNLRKLGRMVAKDDGLRQRLQGLAVVRTEDGLFLLLHLLLVAPPPERQRRLGCDVSRGRARHVRNPRQTPANRLESSVWRARSQSRSQEVAIESCF